MSALDRKLLRDLLRLRGQVVTIAAVIASGIAIFVASLATYYSLQQNQAAYYRASHFADVFVSLKRAPDALLPRLRELPGVAQIEPRIVRDITIDLPDQALPLVRPAGVAARRRDRAAAGPAVPAPRPPADAARRQRGAGQRGLRRRQQSPPRRHAWRRS